MNKKEYNKVSKELWDALDGITDEGVESFDFEELEELIKEQLILKLSGLEDPFAGEE